MNIALDTTVGIKTSPHSADSELLQNYPNPFHHTTTISYSLQKTTNVRLEVFDIFGKKTANLINEMQSAGLYEVEWKAMDQSELTSGFYFIRLSANGQTYTRKMLLVL